jgi:hypothetical protein
LVSPANSSVSTVRGGFVSELNRDQLQQLARLGAQARLEELRREEAAIRAAFPDLSAGRGRGRRRRAAAAEPASAPTGRRRRRRSMSAAARKAVSDRMRKYWAERRKAKGSKSGK